MKYMIIGFIQLVACTQIFAATPEWEYDYTPQLTGPVRVLPGRVTGKLGTTGTKYKHGETWHALVCKSTCLLHPVALNVFSGNLFPNAPRAVDGQKLSIDNPAGGKVIALFQSLPKRVLKRPIKTVLHAGMKQYPNANTFGTMEIGILSPNGSKFRVVPRLSMSSSNATNSNEIRIYLENKTKRQLLGRIELTEYTSLAKGPNLLLWAGDLDGDDRLDLVMSFPVVVGTSDNVVLFLSSQAKSREFVGMVGSYRFDGILD